MTRSTSEPGDPMHGATAVRAVKDQPAELPFQISLHVQKLKAKHLR
jgi:hypothetical protein